MEFSFTDDSNGNRYNKRVPLKNGGFSFNESQYAIYHISFSLDPNVWGGAGHGLFFETKYFCTYNKAITEFDIQINIASDEVKTIELVASEGSSTISSGKMPIDPSGMTISAYIPSP